MSTEDELSFLREKLVEQEQLIFRLKDSISRIDYVKSKQQEDPTLWEAPLSVDSFSSRLELALRNIHAVVDNETQKHFRSAVNRSLQQSDNRSE